MENYKSNSNCFEWNSTEKRLNDAIKWHRDQERKIKEGFRADIEKATQER